MVKREQIEQFANEIAKRYLPEKIILFGSHARGQAYAGSDVDILVVLEHNNTANVDKAVEILDTLDPRFALDLLVRKPGDIKKRVAMNDFFIREIVERGIILYDGNHS